MLWTCIDARFEEVVDDLVVEGPKLRVADYCIRLVIDRR